MNNEEKGASAAAGMLVGLIIGVSLGFLLAPKSGKETRREIKKKFADTTDRAKQAVNKSGEEAIENLKRLEQTKTDDLKAIQDNLAKLSDDIKKLMS